MTYDSKFVISISTLNSCSDTSTLETYHIYYLRDIIR